MYDSDYPYVSGNGQVTACTYNAADGVTYTNSTTPYVDVTGTTADIQNALNQQPVAVAVNAANAGFQTYSSGVLMASECTNYLIDHAITAVGYGNENGVDYYLVQNSWGSGWGENGYVKIEATNTPSRGACAINTHVAYPIIA